LSSRATVTDDLRDWSDLADHGWSGLLIGNGASIAVWDGFRYPSLYATSLARDDGGLSESDKELFDSFRTVNFEAVLSALRTAETVCGLLELDTTEIRARYDSIRHALIEAVNVVHVPWPSVPDDTLQRIKEELLRYDTVYSTNYDLLVYWAVMVGSADGFKDYFWSERFDISDTEIWDKVTKVLYLHGAVHLYRLNSGETLKRRHDGTNLLDAFAAGDWRGALPLFIAEGSAEDKLRSIYGSDYLSFAFSRFSDHRGDLVVFGHSLGEADQHLINVMKSWSQKTIAIALRPGNQNHIVENKVRLNELLKKHALVYFDSTTHPLGTSDLRVET
jgi:hypothetical protein